MYNIFQTPVQCFPQDVYSLGVAQIQSVSMPRLSLYMAILKNPYSP